MRILLDSLSDLHDPLSMTQRQPELPGRGGGMSKDWDSPVSHILDLGATCKIPGNCKKRQGMTLVVPEDRQRDIGL
jgi:hypothetical protein